MSELAISDSSIWRGPGGPRVEIDPDLEDLLNECHQCDGVLPVPGDPDDEDVQELVRQARIYARRRNLSFGTQVDDSGTLLIRVRAKRPYNRKNS